MPDRYREVYESFRWDVPQRFNIAEACCRGHAHDASRVALYWEDEEGAVSAHTFRDLQEHANRLSNALAGLGVKRGDRIGIILPQRPETAIAHIACYQMGAVAMPLSVRRRSSTACRTAKPRPRSSTRRRCRISPPSATSFLRSRT
jgi:acetyl-CoA synthetase